MQALFVKTLLGSALTLYMMVILLRWTAPWLELDLYSPRWKWIPQATDPLLQWLRRILPPMGGTFDWAPAAALLALWVVRIVCVGY
jgi:YggT family protein